MTKHTNVEFAVIERGVNGLDDATVFSDEETARGEVSYIRRHRPGRRVILQRREISYTEVEVWEATDIHPAAIVET
jgi:hypothetical protein